MKDYGSQARITSAIRTVKILLHDIGGGLGHQARLVAVAQAIRMLSRRPVLILALSESRSTALFETASIPVLPLAERDRIARLGWLYDVPQPSKLLTDAVGAIVSSYGPHVVVHDTFVWYPLIKAAKESRAKQAAVIRLPPNVEQFWAEGAMSWDILDKVILIADECVVDATLPPNVAAKAVRVNRIQKTRSNTTLSSRLRVGKRTVVVTAGGGYLQPEDDYFTNVLQVLDMLADVEIVVIPGPCYLGSLVTSVGHATSVVPFTSDLDHLFEHAGLVICRGGYNTISELTSFNTPTICFPQFVDYDDQLNRCLAVAASRPHWRVVSSISDLSEAVQAWHDGMLMPPPATAAPAAADGAFAAAKEILQIC